MPEGSGSARLNKNIASWRPCENVGSTKSNFEGVVAIKEEVTEIKEKLTETSSDSSETFGELSKRANSSATSGFRADQKLPLDTSHSSSSWAHGDDPGNHGTDEWMLSDDEDDAYLEALATVEREQCAQQTTDFEDDCDDNDETDDDCACIVKSEGIDDFSECISDLNSFTTPEFCRESSW